MSIDEVGDPFMKKKFHNAEKLKGGPFGIFQTSILLQNIKKLKGDLLGIFKVCVKMSQTPNNIHKKFWSSAKLEL